MTVEIKILGVGELQKKLNKLTQRYNQGYRIGLEKGAKYLLRESKKIVPVDTGDLKRSGFVSITGRRFDSVATIGYTQYYAIWVHENLDAQHKPGKSAKYLSRILQHRGHIQIAAQYVYNEMSKYSKTV